MTEFEYNECVNNHADGLFRFIVKNLRHEEDARDIVQSSFEKLWKNRDQVEAEKSKSYLFTVGYNQMIDHIRKNKRVHLPKSLVDFRRLTLYLLPFGRFQKGAIHCGQPVRFTRILSHYLDGQGIKRKDDASGNRSLFKEDGIKNFIINFAFRN